MRFILSHNDSRLRAILSLAVGISFILWLTASHKDTFATSNYTELSESGGTFIPTRTPTSVSQSQLAKHAFVMGNATPLISTPPSVSAHQPFQPEAPVPTCEPYPTPTAIPPQASRFQELKGFYFFIDPGHGGTENHAVGTEYGTQEKCWTLKMSLDLGNMLQSHGATVYYSRKTDRTVSLHDRIFGNDPQNTLGNNFLYDAQPPYPTPAHSENNWRLISIHLNAPATPSSTFNRVESFRRTVGSATPTPALGQALAQNLATRVNITFVDPNNSPPYVGDWYGQDLYVIENSEPYWHNNLTESGYLTNHHFEEHLVNTNGQFVYDLAHALYRAFVDFWLIGFEGPHSSPHQDVIDAYWRIVNNTDPTIKRDPGVPQNWNGTSNGFYVRPAYNSPGTIEQDFGNPTDATPIPYGSIIGPAYGGTSYYIPDPIWSKYFLKNGPTSSGPGLPTNDIHTWDTMRGVRGNYFTYNLIQNFERGLITFNNYEGAVFLPNCSDVPTGHWAYSYMIDMVRRFALSNDPYGDALIHPDGAGNNATRGQLAQTLMFAEGYLNCGLCPLFQDTSGDWSDQWDRMAHNQGIISGYTCGIPPAGPCGPYYYPYFLPNNNATRSQFSKMMVLARQWAINTSGGPHFTDVATSDPFYTWIETLYNRGLISGYNCGGPGEPCDPQSRPYFRGGNPVSRAEMAKIVSLALASFPIGNCWSAIPSP